MSAETEQVKHALETHDRLARIETKLDMLIIHRLDQEKRIRSVEQKVWWASGIVAVIAAVVPSWLKSKGFG